MSAAIEFTGLPGSGKSSVVQVLSKTLEREGYEVYDFRQLADYFRLLLRPSPRRLALALRQRKRIGKDIFLRSSKYRADPALKRRISEYDSLCRAVLRTQRLPFKARRNAFVWRVSELAAYRIWERSVAKQREDVILVADEAFTHRAISYFALRPSNPATIRTYLSLCPPFDTVIFLEQTIEVVISRKRVPAWNDQRLFHMHSNYIETQARILAEYISPDPRVWTIAAEKFSSTDEIAGEIWRRLRSAFHNPGSLE